uniref:Transmembrane 9 superfamily member 8 n=1 Tax=Rhizophora mucronata TaxID=61149 RepID=A0A2P2MDA1_RHIMU
MEENCIQDCNHVPRDRLDHFLCVKCSDMGPEIIWGCSIWNHVCFGFLMVRNLGATCFRWSLHWVQEAST